MDSSSCPRQVYMISLIILSSTTLANNMLPLAHPHTFRTFDGDGTTLHCRDHESNNSVSFARWRTADRTDSELITNLSATDESTRLSRTSMKEIDSFLSTVKTRIIFFFASWNPDVVTVVLRLIPLHIQNPCHLKTT